MADWENGMLEHEGDAPEGWVSNTVFVRNEAGVLVEIEVPDDEEGSDDDDEDD